MRRSCLLAGVAAVGVLLASSTLNDVWDNPAPRAGVRPVAQAARAARVVHPKLHRCLRPARIRCPVPILMYHVIGVPGPLQPYPDLWVTPAAFRSQMAALRHDGYHAVTLDHVLAAWQGKARMPRRPIVLTFDDGYLGDYTVARPVLQRLGWPAELNLIESRMWHRDSAGLTPTMIRQLIKDGWVIDSHTITHRDLTTLGPTQLWQEVHRSRVLLQRMFGVPVDGFCYPAGRYNTQVIADVRRAGYRDATTEIVGTATPATNRYQLPRIRVSYHESTHTLIQSLTG